MGRDLRDRIIVEFRRRLQDLITTKRGKSSGFRICGDPPLWLPLFYHAIVGHDTYCIGREGGTRGVPRVIRLTDARRRSRLGEAAIELR